MSNFKPLEQIKLNIDLLSLEIDSMDNIEEKVSAVRHLEERLRMLTDSAPSAKRIKLEKGFTIIHFYSTIYSLLCQYIYQYMTILRI